MSIITEIQPLMEAGTFGGVVMIWTELQLLKYRTNARLDALEKTVKKLGKEDHGKVVEAF